MYICEMCGAECLNIYGSGRFCGAKCARRFSTYSKRKEINLKVSNSLSGRKAVKPKSKESVKKQSDTLKNTLWNKTKDNFVKTYTNETLDITKQELKEYRDAHLVCEICGKKETVITYTGNTGRTSPNKLCVDHNHKTNKFRGLLCQNCNSRLGWYESHKDIIEIYLTRGV